MFETLTTSFLILLINYSLFVSTTPVPSKRDSTNSNKILFDQRQEGQWNIRADLKNFVILIIPAEPSASTSTPPSPLAGGLFNFFRKSPLKRNHHNHINKEKKDSSVQETQHFIESKTAPYHVDISQTKNHLAKLHPDVVAKNEEVLIANSPSIALLKVKDDNGERKERALVLTVPASAGDEEFVLTQIQDDEKKVKKEDKKKKAKEGVKSNLKLIGAENEQCGPGLVRDSYGNCRVYKI